MAGTGETSKNNSMKLHELKPCAHLSKELRKQHKTRAMRLKKGDEVKIVRGQFKGKTGKIERITLKNMKVFITGAEIVKKDGTKIMKPIHPSNLIIQKLTERKQKKEAAK